MSNSSNYNEDSNLEYDASISSFSNFIEESDDLDEDFSIESLSESENVYSDDQMEVDGSDGKIHLSIFPDCIFLNDVFNCLFFLWCYNNQLSEVGDEEQHYFRNMTRGVRENNAVFLDSVVSNLSCLFVSNNIKL